MSQIIALWLIVGLLLVAVVRIWDCTVHLGNIQRLLFEEQAKRSKLEYNKEVWGEASGPPPSLRASIPE